MQVYDAHAHILLHPFGQIAAAVVCLVYRACGDCDQLCDSFEACKCRHYQCMSGLPSASGLLPFVQLSRLACATFAGGTKQKLLRAVSPACCMTAPCRSSSSCVAAVCCQAGAFLV